MVFLFDLRNWPQSLQFIWYTTLQQAEWSKGSLPVFMNLDKEVENAKFKLCFLFMLLKLSEVFLT